MLIDKPLHGFWCECWTEDLTDDAGQPTLRASFDAYTAPQADRWVAITLLRGHEVSGQAPNRVVLNKETRKKWRHPVSIRR
ncbi:hypothetical protein ACWCRD_07300, partial [Streptomyces sp. NPDC002092]